MSWKLFNNVIEQLPSETIIVPFFRGEPTIYPRFADAMEKLRRFKTVQLATNGDTLNNHSETLLHTCSFVSISLHEFLLDGSQYSQFFRAANKRGLTTQVSIVDSLLPEGKQTDFVQSWLKHVDRVRVYVQHTHKNYGDTNIKIIDTDKPCHMPFTDMVVYWDGKVALCCFDWNNQLALGNLNMQSIEEVWQDQPYRLVRSLHEQGKRTSIKSCENCHQWIAEYMPNKILGELYTNG